jgi:hypothetical protein
LDSLAIPGDARFHPAQGHTGAGGVHLTQVNADIIDLNKELVSSWIPVINLIQGKLNRHSVSFQLVWTGTTGDIDGRGHHLTAGSKQAKELRETNSIFCRRSR